MSGEDSYKLISARYDSVSAAEDAFASVRAAYEDAGDDGFDAAVYMRDRWGRFVLHLGTPASDGEAVGGGVADQAGKGVFADPAAAGEDEEARPEDLQRLAELITPGSAALLVAFRPELESLVTANLHSDSTAVSQVIHASDAALRSQVHDARKSARPQSNRGATGV